MKQALVASLSAGAFALAATSAFACTGKLGVARTISINAEKAPLHGAVQYDAPSLLRDGEIVFTFDDGPLPVHTRKILAALKAHCTKATFFMVGRMAVANPSMVREVAGYGHTIASHTWSHKNLKKRRIRRGTGEIELGISAVQHALGKPVAPFFRFPYLADPNALIAYNKSRKIATFSIDIDSYDYRTTSGARVRRTIMRQLANRKKGILLFHDIQISTVRAMPSLLDELSRKGYKVVHIVADRPLRTLAPYDRQAAELHGKRRFSPSIRPVTISGSRVETQEHLTQLRRRPAVSASRPSRIKSRKKTRRRDDSWMNSVFGN